MTTRQQATARRPRNAKGQFVSTKPEAFHMTTVDTTEAPTARRYGSAVPTNVLVETARSHPGQRASVLSTLDRRAEKGFYASVRKRAAAAAAEVRAMPEGKKVRHVTDATVIPPSTEAAPALGGIMDAVNSMAQAVTRIDKRLAAVEAKLEQPAPAE